MNVPLASLNPVIYPNGMIVFDCPNCAGDDFHKIRVPVTKATANRHGCWWKMSGSYENITLAPSIDAGCWHGYVTNGMVTQVNG